MTPRPTAIRSAFTNARVYPETNRDTVHLVARNVTGKGGFVHHRPRTLAADGPRPTDVPGTHATIFSHLREKQS